MGMPASAAIPLPDLALALQEAKHLDQLLPVVPWGKAPIDHSGRNHRGHAPTTLRNSPTGRWLTAIT